VTIVLSFGTTATVSTRSLAASVRLRSFELVARDGGAADDGGAALGAAARAAAADLAPASRRRAPVRIRPRSANGPLVKITGNSIGSGLSSLPAETPNDSVSWISEGQFLIPWPRAAIVEFVHPHLPMLRLVTESARIVVRRCD
jgi:hypothetical protein